MENILLKTNGTIVAKAVREEKVFSSFLFRLLFFCVWIIGIAAALSIPFHFFVYEIKWIGFSYIIFGFFLYYLARRQFYFTRYRKSGENNLKNLRVELAAGKNVNIFPYFSFDLACATINLFEKKELSKISASELAIALCDSKEISFMLLRLGLGRKNVIEALKRDGDQNLGVPFLGRSLEIAMENSHSEINASDLFVALFEHERFLVNVLGNLNIEISDIRNLVHWHDNIEKRYEAERGAFNPESLKFTGGIGRDWAFGYTNFLRRFSIDITQGIKNYGLNLSVIGRDKEIGEIEQTMLHAESGNVIVVGEAGIGKRTTILGFAKKVIEGNTISTLSHKHIFQIDLDAILTGTSGIEELTDRIARVFEEASAAGNVIIFIENIGNLFSSGAGGKFDLSEVLLPYLERATVHVIGTIDTAGYNNYILANPALSQRFTRVSIKEPSKEDLIQIVEDTLPLIESKSRSLVSYEAIKEAIKMADKYILNLPNPEKTINLIEGAVMRAAAERGETIILPKDIDEYLQEKYEIPTGELTEAEKKKLLNLEQEIHESVVGQDEAVIAISSAMRRARAKVDESKKPIGSFLFLGPTGVGKTATAKALAKVYFGGVEKMVRFDMSEYQNKEDIYRLIGENRGGEESQGNLTTIVREKPFSLLLFDEIEKAHPDILNLFLQILDEGIMTDGSGRKVAFTNTIIILTSNAGAEVIRQAAGDAIEYEKVKAEISNYLIEKNIFKPEFLNRFTSVVAFSPLSQTQILDVARGMIRSVEKTVSLNRGIDITVDEGAMSELARLGFDPKMGARPMERVIEDKIENLIANKILSNELEKGSKFLITKEMIDG